jgi:hypothetical protein
LLPNRADLGNEAIAAYLLPGAEFFGVDARQEATMKTFDSQTTLELEAAAFRRLIEHLRTRTHVQNIDLMNLAGFCRNCLSNWMAEAASEKGLELNKDEAREIIYGMPYREWQAKYQNDASPEQQSAFEKSRPQGH